MDSTTDAVASDNRQIARASGIIMFAFIIGQAFSLISGMLISWKFGTGMEYDAFIAANRFPDILYQLVAGGALASAFIPTFTALLSNGDRSKGWKLASAVINLVTLVLLAVGIISFLFAPWIVTHVLAPKFTDLVQIQLTIDLLRIQLLSPIIFGISGLLMGIINSHQSFLWPALAPAMFSVGKIIGVLFLAPSMGIYGLAWGVIAGASMHGLIQIPALLKLPERKYSFILGLKMQEVREVLRLMGPRVLGVAFVQLNFLVNIQIGSGLPIGSIVAINIAFALMMIPEIAIAQSMAIAALPSFSKQVASGKLTDMRSSLAALLRGLLYLAIPASLGLMLLRTPLIAVIYQHGIFDSHSTQLVAWALLFYAAGLVGHSVVEVVSRAFYALHDTKTPVFVGIIMMSLNIGLSLLFSSLFARWGWMPHGGLALANSLATFLEMGVLLFFMRRKLSGLEGSKVLDGVVKALAAGGMMSLALWGWLELTALLSIWMVALGGVAIGILVYVVGLFILRVPELKTVLQLASRLVSRRGARKKEAS
jgi:putative peptidoglycan lipid II flippase